MGGVETRPYTVHTPRDLLKAYRNEPLDWRRYLVARHIFGIKQHQPQAA